MPRDYLPLSPTLPLTPDWQALALECSRAYFALERVRTAVSNGTADGGDYWKAKNRVDRAASTIAAWSSDPALYGRLLARQAMLREMFPVLTAATCQNILDNTPRVDCCVQCRYELGV